MKCRLNQHTTIRDSSRYVDICLISLCSRWKHSEDWYVAFASEKQITCGERTVNILLNDEDYEYISGHVIDGRNLLPATGYVYLIWETLSMLRGQTNVPVVFENVKFLRATHIPSQGSVQLTLMVQKGKLCVCLIISAFGSYVNENLESLSCMCVLQ